MPVRQISSVTFEHHPTGFGIGYASPRVSWRFSANGDDSKNWMQEAYEVQIGRQNTTEAEVYHVQSSESVLVPWPSHALQSREAAWVKVRSHGVVKDEAGRTTKESTEWSSQVAVEAALLEKGDWTAKLTTSTVVPSKSDPKPPTLFRKGFSLPEHSGMISNARLRITAHGVYQAFINGHRVGDEEMAPGWTSYNHRLVYRTFDVTKYLLTDKPNVVGVEVAEGWFAGHIGMGEDRCFYGDRIAFLAQLEVIFENGRKYNLASDGTWKAHNSPITRSEIYNGEDYDSRHEQIGWSSDSNFDESSWLPTEELPFPSARLVTSDSPPVREKEELGPVNIFKSKAGKTLIDFGQNLVGKLRVRLPGSLPGPDLEGHQISFSHAEVLECGELGTRPLRGAKPIDTVTLSKHQPLIWSPKFTFHGFRYVQVDGWPTDSRMPNQDDITALVLYSDMTRTGWFSCSDSLINRLHENVCWSMKGNFFSLPTDCPQRDERLGWTGDIQVFCPSANFIFDTKGFLGSWLDDVASEQLEEEKKGVPGLVVPDIFEAPNPPGPQSVWHDVTVLTPWDLYNSSGDEEILRKQYISMKAWVDKGIMRGPNGLWDKNNWQYGDWLDPAAPPSEPGNGRTDSLIVGDAYLVRVLETISKVSTLLGETENAETYSKDALNTRKAFQHEYIAPSGLLVGDTQTALSLAICFGLYDQEGQKISAASRLAHLVHMSPYRIATGFAGTPLIAHALSDTGNYQLAYRMLLEKSCPSWLYPITMGATTIWERWDSMLPDGSINPGQMTSFNHYALGSVANWLHKNVGGISPLEPGWRKINVRPVPGGTISSADVAYESPYGRIECSWKINDSHDTFSLAVTIPPNSEALVILPSDWKKGVQDGKEQGTKIGSGQYNFSCSYEPAEWPPRPEFARSTFRLEV
jgi:alpha-L-rhamnosidase